MAGKKMYIANYEHLGKVLWGSETIDNLLDTEDYRLQKYPLFKLGWDNEAFTYDALAEDDPALLQKMIDLFNKFPGRIGMGTSTYGQPLSYYIGGESNVRQLVQGIRTVEQYFGVRPDIYIMSEHAFHAQMPQLLAGAGFKGAIMRTHFMMYGCNPEIDASVVNWKGLDKNAGVATIPTYVGQTSYTEINGYTCDARTKENFPFGFNTLDNRILTDWPLTYKFKNLDNFRDEFTGKIETVVASRADDPRQPEEIPATYAGNENYPFIIDNEIMEAVGAPKTDMITGIDDFMVRMPWGYCGNWMWEKGREAESMIYSLEYLDTLMLMAGKGCHKQELADAWKMILINQHHDILICGLEDDARRYFNKAFSLMDGIAGDFCPGGAAAGYLNTLPWTREDPIEALGGLCAGIGGGEAFEIAAQDIAGSGGQARNDGDMRVSNGYNPGRLHLETPYYSVYLNKYGGFDKIIEKKTQYSLFMNDRRSGILAGTIDGKFRVELGAWSAARKAHCITLTDSGFIGGCVSRAGGSADRSADGSVACASTVSRAGGIPYTAEWTFYDSYPRIDCKIEIEMNMQKAGHASEDVRDSMSAFQHEEKLRMKFYPNLKENPIGWRDQPYGAGPTNRTYIEGGLWTALCDDHRGFAILNRGIMESTREADNGLSVPLAFSMYYVWSGPLEKGFGNYRDANALRRELGEDAPDIHGRHFLKGKYTFHITAYPFEGDWKSAKLHRKALEYNQPVLAIDGATLKLLKKNPFKINAPDNIYISSLYHENGKPYLRVYEMEGDEADISVSYDNKLVPLTETDLLENPTGVPQETAKIFPYQVKTYMLNLTC